MEFERPLVKKLASSLRKRLPVFQVLIGPRQVGKTTISRQVLNKLPYPSVYASADSPLPPGPEWIETQWRLADFEAHKTRKPVVLVLDEIQKVRGWSESLKLLWDRDATGGKRYPPAGTRILGITSSGRADRKSCRPLLLTRCPHWSFGECSAAFGWDLRTWLYFGGYPGAAFFARMMSNSGSNMSRIPL